MTRYRCISADPPWLERGGGKSTRGAQRHYPLLKTEDIPRVMMASPLWKPETSCHLWLWATANYLDDALWVMERVGFTYKTCRVWVKSLECTFCNGVGKLKAVFYRDGVKHPHRIVNCKDCHGTGMQPDGIEIGLGQYMRMSHELLLLGTRGKAMVPEPEDRLPSVTVAPRGRHSAKPQAAYDVIERVSPGPRLEMFAREPREGWATWGNEV